MQNIKIRKVREVAHETFKDIHRYQKGEKKIVKTGEEMIDSHLGGLLPGDVVLLSGRSGTGKSEKLYKILDNMLTEEVNVFSENYVSLEYSMEMKMLNKLLRAIHNRTGKKKQEILTEKFTEEERNIVAKYSKGLEDNRRFVVQEPVTPEQYYRMTRDFCKEHQDKDAIIISSDHILLHSGSDKQKVLEKVTEYTNLLKLEFENVYFILVSQLNRNSYPEPKERNNSMRPDNTWLYGSSFMEHVASYIIIIENAYKLGVNDYLKINKKRYNYLSDYFTEEDAKGRVSFDTLGNLFFFITKVRDSDNMWKDIFIEEMNLTEEQLEKMKLDVSQKEGKVEAGDFLIDLPKMEEGEILF